MDFEEMKVIWNTQDDSPMYAIDQNSLHQSVKRKGESIELGVTVFEIAMIAILIGVGLLLASEPLLYGDDWHQLVGAAAALIAGAYLIFGRSRRRHSEEVFDQSLMGDLEKAISRVDYQIARLRSVQWWFVLPMLVEMAMSFWLKFETKELWKWFLIPMAIALPVASAQLELRCFHRPRKHKLEALRLKLSTDS